MVNFTRDYATAEFHMNQRPIEQQGIVGSYADQLLTVCNMIHSALHCCTVTSGGVWQVGKGRHSSHPGPAGCLLHTSV